MKQTDEKNRISQQTDDMNTQKANQLSADSTDTADELLEEAMASSIRRLSDEYRSIPVPPAMKERVQTAICKTDEPSGRSSEKNNSAKSSRRAPVIMLRTIQTTAAALLTITVLANLSPQTAYAMEKIPILGAITHVVTFRTYEKQEGKTEAKVEVPKIESENSSGFSQAAEKVNRSAEEYTNQIIEQFEADVAEDGSENPHALYSDYKVVTDNERFFTLRIDTLEIMASGAQSVKLYTIDKTTDQIVTLSDLFPDNNDYISFLSDAVKTQMRQNMEADSSLIYFLDQGMDSDFTSIKPDQDFYINESGHLVLVFDEYEVAPGYMGIVEIELPDSVYRLSS